MGKERFPELRALAGRFFWGRHSRVRHASSAPCRGSSGSLKRVFRTNPHGASYNAGRKDVSTMSTLQSVRYTLPRRARQQRRSHGRHCWSRRRSVRGRGGAEDHRVAALSFFMFVQRLHQFSTLKAIAAKLAEGLVKATELKHFLGQLCCESYPDAEQFLRERETLERNFPCIHNRPSVAVRPFGGT